MIQTCCQSTHGPQLCNVRLGTFRRRTAALCNFPSICCRYERPSKSRSFSLRPNNGTWCIPLFCWFLYSHLARGIQSKWLTDQRTDKTTRASDEGWSPAGRPVSGAGFHWVLRRGCLLSKDYSIYRFSQLIMPWKNTWIFFHFLLDNIILIRLRTNWYAAWEIMNLEEENININIK